MNLKNTLVGLGLLFAAATANADSACADQSFIDVRKVAKTLSETSAEQWNTAFLQGLNTETRSQIGNGLDKTLQSQTTTANGAVAQIEKNKKDGKDAIDLEKRFGKKLPAEIVKILSDFQDNANGDAFATKAAIQQVEMKTKTAFIDAMKPKEGATAQSLCITNP
jgi:hypothetical protein